MAKACAATSPRRPAVLDSVQTPCRQPPNPCCDTALRRGRSVQRPIRCRLAASLRAASCSQRQLSGPLAAALLLAAMMRSMSAMSSPRSVRRKGILFFAPGPRTSLRTPSNARLSASASSLGYTTLPCSSQLRWRGAVRGRGQLGIGTDGRRHTCRYDAVQGEHQMGKRWVSPNSQTLLAQHYCSATPFTSVRCHARPTLHHPHPLAHPPPLAPTPPTPSHPPIIPTTTPHPHPNPSSASSRNFLTPLASKILSSSSLTIVSFVMRASVSALSARQFIASP